MNVRDIMRGDLKNMEAYHPSARAAEIKLDANESPWGLPESVRQKLIKWIENDANLNRYPDSDNTELRNAVANFHGVAPDNVTCGVGSDQLIDMICRVFLEPGDSVVTQKPTFGMYAVSADLNHGRTVDVPIGYDRASAGEMLRVAELERAKIIFLCRPNNPTGGSMSDEGVDLLLENAKCLVAIDEAYGEFSGVSVMDRISSFPNLAVLRTFSKAYGLAGARVGYVAADSRLIGLIDSVKPPFNLSVISQKLAVWAMEASDEYAARAKCVSAARDGLRESLERIRWLEIDRSESNFLYLKSKYDVASILEHGGVSARGLAKSGGMYCVRVSVGTDEENKKVSDLLCAAFPK
jgi:histidinol-phosphate aminotransferase